MFKQISRLTDRHKMQVWLSILYEAYIRGYQVSWIRPILRIFFRAKLPLGWIFACGSYNAGTTLVKNVLLAHPEVCGLPVEGDTLSSEFPDFEIGGFPRGMYANRRKIETANDPLNFRLICGDWKPWIRSGTYFLDKSISHAFRLPQLRSAFKGSRFVVIVRNPEDVAKGIRERSRPFTGKEYEAQFLDEQWLYFYTRLLQDAKADTIFCSYEMFIASPVAETKRLYEFLGLKPVSIKIKGDSLAIGDRSLHIRPLPADYRISATALDQLRFELEKMRGTYEKMRGTYDKSSDDVLS